MTSLLPAVLALTGVVVGACLSPLLAFLFGRRTEALKTSLAARTVAYADFTRALAGVVIAQRSGDEPGERVALTLLMDAKARIAIHGSAEVVGHMANVWRLGAKFSSPEQITAFTELVAAMRADAVPAGGRVARHDLTILLVGAGSGHD